MLTFRLNWYKMFLAVESQECQNGSGTFCIITGGDSMSKTKSSKSGVQNKKIVPVKPYKKADGTKVKGHRRSTPN